MWDGFFMLLTLCVVMAAASFLAGSVPLSFSLSQRQLRLMTALGTGVLVGTSLIVIIPEGVDTLYSAAEGSYGHAERSLSMRARSADLGRDLSINWNHASQKRDAMGGARWARAVPPGGLGMDITHESDGGNEETDDPVVPPVDPSSPSEPEDHADEESNKPTHHDPHAWIGPPLILGFILMYLIDTLPRHASSPSQPQRFHISLDRFSFNRAPSVSDAEPSSAHPDNHPSRNIAASKASSTTIGLVIHAAADGIALGASSTTTSRLSFIIFIALMIHKAPAAFGLTSVLLKQNLSKRTARAHLIVFALSAPVGALLTWAVVNLLGYGGLPETMSTEFATGVLLLFSAGTFLYVAMHTMQDADDGHNHGSGTNGHAGGGYSELPGGMGMYEPPSRSKQEGKGITDTLVTVVGMLLPLLTTFGHAH